MAPCRNGRSRRPKIRTIDLHVGDFFMVNKQWRILATGVAHLPVT